MMKLFFNLTNLMNVPFISGIQRVVIESLRHILQSEHECVLFTFDQMKNTFYHLDQSLFLAYYLRSEGEKEHIMTDTVFHLHDVEPSAIYYDIDASWNNLKNNAEIYKELKTYGCKIVTYIYDIVPIKMPWFSHERTVYNFMLHFTSVLKYADEIHVSAEATKQDILDVAEKAGLSPNIKILPLASNFEKAEITEKPNEKIISRIDEMGEILLMVGTVEPRKNHSFILDLLDRSDFDNLNKTVVIIGRVGWNSEDLKERIDNHPLNGKKLFHFDNIDDATLEAIYPKAYALLFPSFYEGFGLPIVESLSRGVPVFASDVGILKEVGGNFCEYFNLESVDELYTKLLAFKKDPHKYEAWKKTLSQFEERKWADSSKLMLLALEELNDDVDYGDIKIKQIVCLSARSETILDTLVYIENLIPFVEEVVITSPENMVDVVKSNYIGKLRLKFLTDEGLMKGKPVPKDHSTRNFLLRALTIQEKVIDPYFILYDDDARPLVPISHDVFVKDGKLNAHYFYKLDKWRHSIGEPTSFDFGGQKTKNQLVEWNCPVMYYCSHMPQAMSKAIWLEMLPRIDNLETAGLVEWTLFYNYGIKFHPHLFNRVPYKTLCWPGMPSDWELTVYPDSYFFENYYEDYYAKDGIFEGYSKKFTDIPTHVYESMRKIEKRATLQRKHDAGIISKKQFESTYQKDHGILPSFFIKSNDGKPELFVPAYYVVKQSKAEESINTKLVFDFIKKEKTQLDAEIHLQVFDAIRKDKMLHFNGFFSSSALDFDDLEVYFKNPDLLGRFLLRIHVKFEGKSLKAEVPLFVVE